MNVSEVDILISVFDYSITVNGLLVVVRIEES